MSAICFTEEAWCFQWGGEKANNSGKEPKEGGESANIALFFAFWGVDRGAKVLTLLCGWAHGGETYNITA